MKDINEWANEMQDLYKTYVLESELKQGQQDPKSIDEMGRQIFHLEKSIFQINKSTGKVIVRREKEIHKKTKENAELIYDLNDIRKENKDLKIVNSNICIQRDTYAKESKNL